LVDKRTRLPSRLGIAAACLARTNPQRADHSDLCSCAQCDISIGNDDLANRVFGFESQSALDKAFRRTFLVLPSNLTSITFFTLGSREFDKSQKHNVRPENITQQED
jgi:hypothetical protein